MNILYLIVIWVVLELVKVFGSEDLETGIAIISHEKSLLGWMSVYLDNWILKKPGWLFQTLMFKVTQTK